MAGFALPRANYLKEMHATETEPFVRHEGEGKFDNWVGQSVPLAPVQKILKMIEERHGVKLTGRPEAHVTVLTPLEYPLLQPILSIKQINNIVERDLQKRKFKVICLGRGEAMKDGRKEQTFFIVVSSPELLEVRRKLQAVFVSEGGKGGINPEEFFPHITVGFTKTDLHLEDGVIKDFRSCVSHLD